MPHSLSDHTVAILTTEGVDRVELAEPRKALLAAGATVDLVALDTEPFRTFDGLDPTDVEEQPDVVVTSRNPDDIPAFSDTSIEEYAEGRHRAQARSVR